MDSRKEPQFKNVCWTKPVPREYARQFDLLSQEYRPPCPAEVAAVINVNDCWVEAAIDDQWIAAYRLIAQEGSPVIAEIRIFPAETERPLEMGSGALPKFPGMWSAEVRGSLATAPAGGITARLIRKVKVGEHQKFVDQFLTELHQHYGNAPFESSGPAAVLGIRPPGMRQRHSNRGRKGRPDIFYARLAEEYHKKVNIRGSRKPIFEMARRRGIDIKKMRAMIHEARMRDLLGPKGEMVWGRWRGFLTQKARRMLASKCRIVALS